MTNRLHDVDKQLYVKPNISSDVSSCLIRFVLFVLASAIVLFWLASQLGINFLGPPTMANAFSYGQVFDVAKLDSKGVTAYFYNNGINIKLRQADTRHLKISLPQAKYLVGIIVKRPEWGKGGLYVLYCYYYPQDSLLADGTVAYRISPSEQAILQSTIHTAVLDKDVLFRVSKSTCGGINLLP